MAAAVMIALYFIGGVLVVSGILSAALVWYIDRMEIRQPFE